MERRTVTVSGKITPTAKAALDAIAAATPFKPSVSKLVETAVEEFIEHHPIKPANRNGQKPQPPKARAGPNVTGNETTRTITREDAQA